MHSGDHDLVTAPWQDGPKGTKRKGMQSILMRPNKQWSDRGIGGLSHHRSRGGEYGRRGREGRRVGKGR